MPVRSRSLLATLFGRSAGPKRRRPARSHRRPIGAEQLESRAMLAGLSIDGGLSWDGWTNRGLSNQGGLYGSGGTTGRDTYEVYTTTFTFAGNAIENNPVQAVAPAPDGFASGRFAPIPGGREIRVSDGAFQAGNTILGIGVRATTSDGSIAGFWPTIRFDLDNDSYRPASFEVDSAGRTIKLNNDGRTSFTTYAEPGDFTVQFEGSASWRGSSISVREAATAQLLPATVQLPGGVGSGTSYDFAFRAFAQPAAKSYQMFLDMTAIPKLYGSVYRTFFPARAGVGAIGDRVTVSLNGLGSNNVVFDANLGVDLDVDSDNANTIPDPANDSLDRSAAEEAIEEDLARPGVIVPVGGDRVKMIADVPQGMTATLAFAQGTDSVRVYDQATAGDPVLEKGKESTRIVGSGSPQAFWIEAFAPSASIPSIAFSLTLDVGAGSGSTSRPPRDLIRAKAVALDLDVDSNNDGAIDPDNGPAGKDDRIEEQSPGRIIFANTDDDDGNGIADALDAGPVESESDLARVLLTVAPDTARGNILLTYDDSIVGLYKHASRHGPIASGVITTTDGFFYVEGRSAGTTLVTATYPDATSVTDTIRFTVLSHPDTIDVDIDSDNNNDFLRPARSEWEEILEDHEYGIGKLIMLDNDRRSLTPVVLEIPAGLPENDPAVGVRIDWNGMGLAGEVRLWNRVWADGVRNPAPVSQGGNRIEPGARNRLADLNYNPQTGTLMLWAEGVRENEQLKTLAGVEAAPRVDERIRGTLVVNGDAAAFDEVKYIVANEDSFYHALHTRQEVRNALASRDAYSFAPMPKFSLQPKSPLDLLRLGVPNDANLLLGEGSGIDGFKAILYQDYITGEDQYVLAFGGTDGLADTADWYNDIVQGLGLGAPKQYVAAMLIGDRLATQSDIPAGHLIVTGHSLGGGLASAAAVVGGFRADTFNAAWLRKETLLEPDGMGGFRESYPGSLARFAGATGTIDAYYIDWDILTFLQRRLSNVMSIQPVGTLLERDGPHDTTIGEDFYLMYQLHLMPSVLYGLLVREDSFGGFTIDMLGYDAYFGN